MAALSDPLQNMATFGLGKLFPDAGANTLTNGNENASATRAEPALKKAEKGPTFTPEQRGELLRWAHGETERMAEEAQFAEDGTLWAHTYHPLEFFGIGISY